MAGSGQPAPSEKINVGCVGVGGMLDASAKDYYASLHRVAYSGDYTRSIRHLAHLMGLKVIQEG